MEGIMCTGKKWIFGRHFKYQDKTLFIAMDQTFSHAFQNWHGIKWRATLLRLPMKAFVQKHELFHVKREQ